MLQNLPPFEKYICMSRCLVRVLESRTQTWSDISQFLRALQNSLLVSNMRLFLQNRPAKKTTKVPKVSKPRFHNGLTK